LKAFRHKSLVIAGIVLAVIVVLALLAPVLPIDDPYAQNLSRRNIPPVWYQAGSWEHPFGTDQLGRDYLARIIFGARISLAIGIVVVLISGVIGTTLGLMAGFLGGKVDSIVMFIVTTRLAIPVILVALAVVALVGSSLAVVIAVLGLLKWDRFAVVIRGVTQEIRSLDYIAAAMATGARTPLIIVREVLPNIVPHLIVIATLECANAILLEAALSFLGLGVQPPLPSWGLMISEARADMFFSYWLIAIPGVALAVLIFAINVIGDALRDLLAPEDRR
jgi:peptide/nickel transport system permease protein